MSSRVKKEKKKSYPLNTKLAVDLYANGNFFEARLKNYRDDKRYKDANWVYMEYLDEEETKGWIDLNIIEVMELVDEDILTLEDSLRPELNFTDEEKGFLGRRVSVAWVDDAQYTGTITKTMKTRKTFVFISYDNGDKCWYNLEPACECAPQVIGTSQDSDGKTNGRKSKKAKTASKVKDERDVQPSSSTLSSSKKSTLPGPEPDAAKHEMARKELETKYPVGCTIAVDVYHDEHYHEAIVKKYLLTANKKQIAHGEQWVYIQFLDKSKTKQWIDLNCIAVMTMTPEKCLSLDKLENGDDKGFLGKRIVVEWPDGNKYRGLATRSAKDNKHFVFLEYDDGDQCWCDLQRESEWNIDGDDPFDDQDNDNNDDDDDVDADEKDDGIGSIGDDDLSSGTDEDE